MRLIATRDDIDEGLATLVLLDPRLAPVIERAGTVPLRRRTADFAGLAEIIVSQMVSKASAAAIWRRLLIETGGTVTAAGVAVLDDLACRRIGLSRAKEETLRRAAHAFLTGMLDHDWLCSMETAEAVRTMTAVQGIGPWTAEVYLLFCAGHPDIFPAGDVALQHGVGEAFALGERPSAKALRELSLVWQPWRGVAARLFWAYYAALKGRSAMPVGNSPKHSAAAAARR